MRHTSKSALERIVADFERCMSEPTASLSMTENLAGLARELALELIDKAPLKPGLRDALDMLDEQPSILTQSDIERRASRIAELRKLVGE